ncbi:MAG: lipid-A-disaccharide synthase [Deferribacteraceae bacterium]|jgi:lipid-A-disaccharide synthase|nr:lipid-A-disaccharide synthase [Deferribacteraceae bacterium]
MRSIKLFIIAGEPSGDIHAANLVGEIIAAASPCTVSLSGAGGVALAKLGQFQFASVSELAVIGFIDAVKKLIFFFRLSKRLEQHVAQEKPDVILLIDYTSFNLRFAQKVKKYNIPIIQFSAPQVWIWRYSRVKILAKFFDKVLCLLPFEEPLLKKEGVNAVYIGHPAAARLDEVATREDFCRKFSLPLDEPIIALAPGSRHREINYLMPVIAAAAKTLKDEGFKANFILARANCISEELIKSYIPKSYGLNITIVEGEAPNIFKHSDIIWICSGTATLEAGILGTPMIILYKAPAIDVIIIKALTKLRMIGLPNIILGREAAPEVKGRECTPENLVKKTREMLRESAMHREALAPLKDMFTNRSAMKNAAKEVLEVIQQPID